MSMYLFTFKSVFSASTIINFGNLRFFNCFSAFNVCQFLHNFALILLIASSAESAQSPIVHAMSDFAHVSIYNSRTSFLIGTRIAHHGHL